MKSLLLSTFLLLSLVSFSQTRDEITSRHGNGMKSIVITYSGMGNSEKILKKSYYDSNCLVPQKIETYGSKIDATGRNLWKVVKIEYFKNGGHFEDDVWTD